MEEVIADDAAPVLAIYRSAKETPLHVLIRLEVHGDLTALIKDYPEDLEELSEEFLDVLRNIAQALQCEKADLIGGIQISALVNRTKEINAKAARQDRIQVLIETARKIFSEELIAELALEGFKAQAHKMLELQEDEEGYQQQLDTIEAMLMPDRIRLEQMRKDIPTPDPNAPKTTEEGYEDNLIALSEMMKQEVTENVTVYRYCRLINRLRKRIEALNKPTHGRRRKTQ